MVFRAKRRRIRSPLARRRRRVIRRTRYRKRRPKHVIVPDSQFVKFRYVSNIDTVLGHASFPNSTKIFHLNGLWDAESGVGNANAPGFLEYAAFYRNYLVTYAVLRAEFTCIVQPLAPDSSNLTTAPSYYVGLSAFSNAITMPSIWSDFLRLKGSPWSVQRSISAASGMNRVRLKLVVPLARLSGNRRNYLSDNLWVGNFGTLATGSNPSSLLRGLAYVISEDGNAFGTNNVVSCRATLTMYARCFNRNNLFS